MNSDRRYHLMLLWEDENETWLTASLPEAIKHIVNAYGCGNKPKIFLYPETHPPESFYKIQEYYWENGELKRK